MSEPRKNQTIRLTETEHRKLKLAAKQDGRTISAQIVYMTDRRLAEIRDENASYELDEALKGI